MSILIKGMEMPDVRQAYAGLVIRWDGKVYPFSIPQGYELGESVATAVSVSPHGDLIDRDALIKDGWLNLHKEVIRMGGYAVHELPLKNPSIPVIIPAEEEANGRA